MSNGDATPAAVSTCRFRAAHPASGTPAKSVSLMARYASSPNKNAANEVRGTLSQMGTVKDVPGIGDTALWVFRATGPVVSGQLNVFQQGSVYLIVTVGGIPDETAALNKAKTLAQAALRRL
jgi:hypothetical protein